MKYLLFIILSFTIFSCRIIHPNDMFKTGKDFKYSEFKESEKEYQIQPFDVLDIQIFTNDGYRLINVGTTNNAMQNRNNSIDYNVEYDGFVKLPSLGRVDISNKTLREAEEFLEKQYETLYQNPFVKISVTNRRVIMFSGGSENGKVIDLKNENYTLIEALAEAGGLSNLSKAYRIKLIRGDLNNPEIFLFNVSKIEDMQKANFLLEANDIIYVEARPKYASRIMSEISPYLSIITTGLLIYGLFGN